MQGRSETGREKGACCRCRDGLIDAGVTEWTADERLFRRLAARP
jgi:hypothetical protein